MLNTTFQMLYIQLLYKMWMKEYIVGDNNVLNTSVGDKLKPFNIFLDETSEKLQCVQDGGGEKICYILFAGSSTETLHDVGE